MKCSIMMAALLTLLLSVDAAALPQQKNTALKEIWRTVAQATNVCNHSKSACRGIFVREAIPEQSPKALLPNETFCRAAAALEKVKTKDEVLHRQLNNLIHALRVNRNNEQQLKPVKCLMDEDANVDEEIDLLRFLKTLLKFTQRQYRKLADKASQSAP